MSSPIRVNFLNVEHEKAARRTTAAVALVFTLFVGILSAVGGALSYRSVTRGTNVLMEIGNLPVIADLRHLAQREGAAGIAPAQAADSRLNIMLFGVGGPGHEGSQLTDTIMLVSVDLTSQRIATVSIPRDLAFPLGDGRFEKINALNAYAEQEHPGEGAQIAANDIGKLFNVPIQHVIKIDFAGFEKFIDALGGIDVNVERSFTDSKYPLPDGSDPSGRVMTVSFKIGEQHMNGARALIYARSRKGSNGESSDLARAKRQQLVLEAVRSKLTSLGTLGNPSRIANIWNAVSKNVQTDLSIWDLVKYAKLATTLTDKKPVTHVLHDGEDGQLIPSSSADLGFIFYPRKPDWSEIRDLVANPFENDEEIANKNKPIEIVQLEIHNGTFRTGFAGAVTNLLKKSGYLINDSGNATQRDYDKTLIVDLTGGAKTAELVRLKKMLNANLATVTPIWVDAAKTHRAVYADGLHAEPIAVTSTDFLIILGDSSYGLVDQIY